MPDAEFERREIASSAVSGKADDGVQESPNRSAAITTVPSAGSQSGAVRRGIVPGPPAPLSGRAGRTLIQVSLFTAPMLLCKGAGSLVHAEVCSRATSGELP